MEAIETYRSPNKKHGFDFLFEGEIRFGPTYYKIKFDGEFIKDRIFGFEFKWHPDSTFLALQEWLTIDYQKGPITALTLIDLQKRKFAKISIAEKGFIIPTNFKNGFIIFEKECFGTGKRIEYEIKIDEIKNWE